MSTGFHHLTSVERCWIYALRKTGFSNRSIGGELGRSHTTIDREVKRNSGARGYRHQRAQRFADGRRSRASAVAWKMTPDKWQFVTDRLEEGWSPEQISGRCRLEGREMAGRQRIYNHIHDDRRAGGRLYQNLRRRGKKPNWRRGRHSGCGHIPGRVDISERPAIVEEKTRVGDWELDTIIGARHSGALVSAVDRATKITRLARVDLKTAEAVSSALEHRLGPDRDLILPLTADNGKEFARHAGLSKKLATDFYFAQPYHSWERGLNEHTNGLVRQYFPKTTDFRKVTDTEVQDVEDRLNRRPRCAVPARGGGSGTAKTCRQTGAP